MWKSIFKAIRNRFCDWFTKIILIDSFTISLTKQKKKVKIIL